MNLYIKVVDGNIIDHPILLENLLLVFPDINPENIPSPYVKFERIPQPHLSPFEKNLQHSYQIVDGIVKDVWTYELMTLEEKAQVTASTQVTDSWIFNRATGTILPPKPFPGLQLFAMNNEGIDAIALWQEDLQSWKIVNKDNSSITYPVVEVDISQEELANKLPKWNVTTNTLSFIPIE